MKFKNISNYTSYFHDGSIMEIDHYKNNLIISMESAEINKEDIEQGLKISKNNRIAGKLHVEGIKKIKENENQLLSKLTMKYEDAEILHLEITGKNLKLEIFWNTIPPKPTILDFSLIEVEAEKVWWENIPDLI
jgi:hypothetical protein